MCVVTVQVVQLNNSRPNNKLQFDEQGDEVTELGQPILYYRDDDDKIIVRAKHLAGRKIKAIKLFSGHA